MATAPHVVLSCVLPLRVSARVHVDRRAFAQYITARCAERNLGSPADDLARALVHARCRRRAPVWFNPVRVRPAGPKRHGRALVSRSARTSGHDGGSPERRDRDRRRGRGRVEHQRDRRLLRATARHRTSSTRRRRPASTTSTPATSSTSSVVAWPRSTATTTGSTSCSSAAAPTPPRSIGTTAPIGGALRFERRPSSDHRSDRTSPGRTRSTSTATASWISPCCAELAAMSCCAGSATAVSRTPTTRSASTAATTGPSASAPRGRDRTTCRHWRSAATWFREVTSVRDSRLVRPTPAGDRYAPAGRAQPRLLHVVDPVQRLEPVGPARPADGERPALLHRRHGTALATSLPVRRRALYTEADGWVPLQIWGMGIASQDVTGDGYPEVFLTSQGDNKLQTLADGPAQPTYHDIALDSGVTAQRPYAGGDVLPSTAWHPEFEDVNNDGIVDLFITKGNVEAQVDYAEPRSEQPADRPARRHVRRRGRGGRHRLATSEAAARRSSTSTSTGCSTSSWSTVRRTRRSGATSVRGDADQPAPMGHWIAIRLRQPAPNVDAIGSWVEVRAGDRTVVREITVGGGHAGGKNGMDPCRTRRRDDVRRYACSGPTARPARGSRSTPTSS